MILFIISMLLLPMGEAEICPQSCVCYHRYASCDSAKSLPTGFQLTLTSLSLPNHNIAKLSGNDFSNHTTLEELSITNGTLTTLQDGCFDHLTSLTNLNLHNTRIVAVNTNTFLGLENLTCLNLSATHITVLEGAPFNFLKSLRTLNMRDNHQLLKVAMDAFIGLDNLEELIIGSREVRLFSMEAFHKLPALTHLVLEDFPFPKIGAFPQMPSLQRLCIDRWTNLQDPGHLTTSIPKLNELSITSGDLQRIPVESLNSTYLEILKLDNNPDIRDLRLHDFEQVRNLKQLSLSKTGLMTIHEAPFHDNLQLITLDLSRNHLEVLPVHTLFTLFELEKLNISYNNFTTLRPGALENARLLKDIDLTGNKIVCDCDLKWLKNWHSFNIGERHIHGNCASPRTHKGTRIAGIDSKFFECTPPHFEEHNITVAVPMNDSAMIDCIPDGGSPDPSIKWSDPQARNIPSMADTEQVPLAPGMWQLPNGSLYIEHMRKQITGIYRCIASNKEGASIKTYKLQSKSPLEPIEIPNDNTTSTTATFMILIGLLLPVCGALWYIRKRSSYRSILENSEGVKWNSV